MHIIGKGSSGTLTDIVSDCNRNKAATEQTQTRNKTCTKQCVLKFVAIHHFHPAIIHCSFNTKKKQYRLPKIIGVQFVKYVVQRNGMANGYTDSDRYSHKINNDSYSVVPSYTLIASREDMYKVNHKTVDTTTLLYVPGCCTECGKQHTTDERVIEVAKKSKISEFFAYTGICPTCRSGFIGCMKVRNRSNYLDSNFLTRRIDLYDIFDMIYLI
jgi:hypothetical protein